MTTFKELQASSFGQRRRAGVRAVRVLLAFGFQAGPAQWTALVVATAFNPIAGLAGAYAAKLLTDAVLRREWDGVLAYLIAIALARIGPGSRVLEIGCGTAQLTVPRARRGCDRRRRARRGHGGHHAPGLRCGARLRRPPPAWPGR